MRAIRLGAFSVGALAFFTFVESATAQTPAQTPPSAVLNAAEVQMLVKRAEPADHGRLSAHFAALADRSTADAKRHTAMGWAYGGNAGRRLSTNPAAR